jgi:outer membrane protein
MEMDPTTQITVEKPDISKLTDVKTVYDANEVIKTAFGINPDIQLAEIQQQGYAQLIKVAQGGYYPILSLYGGAGSSYSNQIPSTFYNQFFNVNFNQYFGLNLQIPIFNKFTTRTTVRKAKLNYEYAQLTTQLAKNTLSKTIIQALADLQAAVKNYQSASHTYESTKEALNVTKQRYDAGFVNTLDYNTAVTNYNKAQNDMINARYSMVFRSKVIDYYLGNKIEL